MKSMKMCIKNPLSHEISLKRGKSSYQFELSDTEVMEQPLIPVEDG